MKKTRILYSEDSVTYWPFYTVSIMSIIFISIFALAIFSTSAWILIGKSTLETKIGAGIFTLLVTLISFLVCRWMLKKKNINITVSEKDIVYRINSTKIDKVIAWEKVSKVYFCENGWYGTRTCKIYLNSNELPFAEKKESCFFILPIQNIDEQSLIRYIPRNLWENRPWLY